MKIAFNTHVIYDCGDRKEEPTMQEAWARLKKGELDIEWIPIFFEGPTVILTPKEGKHDNK